MAPWRKTASGEKRIGRHNEKHLKKRRHAAAIGFGSGMRCGSIACARQPPLWRSRIAGHGGGAAQRKLLSASARMALGMIIQYQQSARMRAANALRAPWRFHRSYNAAGAFARLALRARSRR